MSLLLGLVTQFAALWLLPEETPGRFAIAVALVALAWCAVIVFVMRLIYAPLAYDVSTRRVRMGRRIVPLDSVTRVRRSISTNGTAAYLTYRFFSTEGASVRVLAAGRPFRGLDETALRELRRLVAAAPVAGPDDELTGRRDVIAANLQASSSARAVEVSAVTLLAEIDGILGDPPAAPSAAGSDRTTLESNGIEVESTASAVSARSEAPGARTVTKAEADALVSRWAADDADADAVIAALPKGRRIWRRIGFWILCAVVVGFVVVVAGAVAWEQIEGGRLSSDDNDTVVAPMLTTLVVGLVGAVIWTLAADAHTAQLRRAGREWMAAGDAERRERGLATPFQAAMADGSNRARIGAAFTGLVVALLAVLGGFVGLSEEPEYFVFAIIAIVSGCAIGALSIWGWIVARRRKAAATLELVELAALRIDPPALLADSA